MLRDRLIKQWCWYASLAVAAGELDAATAAMVQVDLMNGGIEPAMVVALYRARNYQWRLS